MINNKTFYYEKYKGYKNKVDEQLKNFIELYPTNSSFGTNKNIITGCNEHIYNPISYLLNAGGKRIRPILLSICCELTGGKTEDCLDAAIAIEMLHNFTLVHDDIMDNADTRRGLDTIHKKWSINTAILSGDALLALSYKAVLKTKSEKIQDIMSTFTEAIIEICEGQAMDKEFESFKNIKISDYLLMIRKKTSELVKASAVIGGMIGGADNKEINALSDYAENIGFAYQIQDDLLDVYSTEKKFGKKIGGDITEKKKTYLYLTALELASKDEKDRLTEIYNSDYVDSIRKEAVINIYNKNGILNVAKDQIHQFTEKALSSIELFKDNSRKEMLIWFSDMLLNRTY